MKANPVRFTAKLEGPVATLFRSLGGAGRKTVNEGAAAEMFALVRGHLRTEAAKRHRAATALGATPTGHLEKAAQSVSPEAAENEASVTVNSPGITRAFHALDIRPRAARSLTIPVHAFAYGRRAAEAARGLEGGLFRPKGKSYLMGRVEGTPTVLYLLRSHVRQAQDRSLLPSDGEIAAAAARGACRAILDAIGGAA